MCVSVCVQGLGLCVDIYCVCVCVCQRDAGRQDKDIYEEFLTQKEIQDNINLVNGQSVSQSVSGL